jgi:hypothetical protein
LIRSTYQTFSSLDYLSLHFCYYGVCQTCSSHSVLVDAVVAVVAVFAVVVVAVVAVVVGCGIFHQHVFFHLNKIEKFI